MLLLLFRSAGNLYAMDSKRVLAVVPRVALRPIPHAPAHVAGLLNYHGQVVPVVDFGVLLGHAPARDSLDTRMILVEISGQDGSEHLLAVLAENVSQVVNVDAKHGELPTMSLEEAPYLGSVFQLDQGLVQLITSDKLLSERLQDALFGRLAKPR